MVRERVTSGAVWEERLGYSRAVRAGNVVAVSGTVGRNADGSVPADPYAQAKRALQIIVAALDALGASPEHVTRTRTYVTDIALFPDVARAHAEVFHSVKPAASFVQVAALIEPAYLVEIEADAVIA